VLPESIRVGGGAGPSVVGSMLTVLLTFISLLGMLGVPPSHALAVGPGVGLFSLSLSLFLVGYFDLNLRGAK
jgi:hypothetical protein